MPDIKRILLAKTRKACARRRKWIVILTESPHGLITRWAVQKDLSGGQYRNGRASFSFLPFDQWPPVLRDFVAAGQYKQPDRAVAKKPKLSLLDQRAEKAAKALAAWITRAKVAVGKVGKYSKQVAYYEKKKLEAAKAKPRARRAMNLNGE